MSTSKPARSAPRGDAASVRERAREWSSRAFRGRTSLGEISQVVRDVLGGVVKQVDASIPASKRSVLREVFDNLREGVHALASAGSNAAGELRERGRTIYDKNVPAATRRLRAANDEFLGAVKGVARTSSRHVREELDSLVARAKRTGPRVTGSMRSAAGAADGRLMELTGETARAGVTAARRGASVLAMGAGGLLEGMAEAIAPDGRATKGRRGTKRRAAKARPGGTRKPARKKTAKKKKKKRARTR